MFGHEWCFELVLGYPNDVQRDLMIGGLMDEK